MTGPFVRIQAPHFCAGVEVGGRCAPVLSYMRGWSLAHILAYAERKGWRCEVKQIETLLRERAPAPAGEGDA